MDLITISDDTTANINTLSSVNSNGSAKTSANSAKNTRTSQRNILETEKDDTGSEITGKNLRSTNYNDDSQLFTENSVAPTSSKRTSATNSNRRTSTILIPSTDYRTPRLTTTINNNRNNRNKDNFKSEQTNTESIRDVLKDYPPSIYSESYINLPSVRNTKTPTDGMNSITNRTIANNNTTNNNNNTSIKRTSVNDRSTNNTSNSRTSANGTSNNRPAASNNNTTTNRTLSNNNTSINNVTTNKTSAINNNTSVNRTSNNKPNNNTSVNRTSVNRTSNNGSNNNTSVNRTTATNNNTSPNTTNNMSMAKDLSIQQGAGFNDDLMPSSGIYVDTNVLKKLSDVVKRTNTIMQGGKKNISDDWLTSDNNMSSSFIDETTSPFTEKSIFTQRSANKNISNSYQNRRYNSNQRNSNSVDTDTTDRNKKSLTANDDDDDNDSISDISSDTESSISFGQDGGQNKRTRRNKTKTPVNVNIEQQGEYDITKNNITSNGRTNAFSDLFTVTG